MNASKKFIEDSSSIHAHRKELCESNDTSDVQISKSIDSKIGIKTKISNPPNEGNRIA